MRFKTMRLTGGIPNGAVIYRPEEYSFAVDPVPSGGFTSVLFDDLHVELNQAGRVISVWGLCPHTRWNSGSAEPPTADFGEAVFVPDAPLAKGISLRLSKQPYHQVVADRESGWVHLVGEDLPASSVKILTGLILDFSRQSGLCGIWLRPDSLPTFD